MDAEAEGGRTTSRHSGPDRRRRRLRTAAAMLRTWARRDARRAHAHRGRRPPSPGPSLRAGHPGQPRPWPPTGSAPGDRVAFLDRNGIEYFEVFFGCALLGAVSVAVNWRLAPAEMAAIIEDAGATVLFFGPDYAAAVKEVTPQVTLRPGVGAARPSSPSGATPVTARRRPIRGSSPAPDDVVTQLYTSGTTGLPKGVMISGQQHRLPS